ncbi:hypothetical protein ACXR0O_25180 [Verrucomicrobiota bacterium sgz303538]
MSTRSLERDKMKREKGVISRGSLIEFEEIARSATRAALESYEIPAGLGEKLVLGTLFDGDDRVSSSTFPGSAQRMRW